MSDKGIQSQRSSNSARVRAWGPSGGTPPRFQRRHAAPILINRQLLGAERFARGRFLALGLLSLVTLVGAKGCDSNYIGVQDYGTVIGNVVDQTGKPIANALVRVTGSTTTSSTDAKGGFYLQHVAVGEQTVTGYAAGYNGSVTCDAIVVKDKTASCGNLSLLSSTAPQQLQRQTPAPIPTPT